MITPSKSLIQDLSTMNPDDIYKAIVHDKRKTSNPETIRNLKAHAGYLHPQLFVWFYLRDTNVRVKPFTNAHIDILNTLHPGDFALKMLIKAPRGLGKSTIVLRWIPLWRICYKNFDLVMDYPPEEYILMIGRNTLMSKRHLSAVKHILETNPLIRRDFGNLVGDTWAKTEAETSNGVRLEPSGRGGSPRGALSDDSRPTLNLCDDLEDPKRCLNPDLRDEDWEWFMTDVMFTGDFGENRTNTIYIDTVKHPQALAVKLANTPGWRSLHFEACTYPHDIYHPTHEFRWKEWERFYADTTLNDVEREEQAQAFYESNKDEMKSGVSVLWGDEMDYLKIRQLVVERGYHECMRELQNDARDPNMALFDMENAVTFRVTEEGFRRSDGRTVPWAAMGGYTTYLDTMGGRDAIENSFACAVVVVWEPLPGGGRMNPDSLAGTNAYVMLAWMERVALTDQLENAILLAQRAEAMLADAYPKSNFVVEQRPDQDGTIAQATNLAFQALKERHRFDASIQWHPQHQNKEDRIDTLEPNIKNGWLAFNEQELAPEFWTQFRQYPSADHNDAPDAVQGACRARITTTARQRFNDMVAKKNRRSTVRL